MHANLKRIPSCSFRLDLTSFFALVFESNLLLKNVVFLALAMELKDVLDKGMSPIETKCKMLIKSLSCASLAEVRTFFDSKALLLYNSSKNCL